MDKTETRESGGVHESGGNEGRRFDRPAMLESLLNCANAMIVYLDPEFNFLLVNDAYERGCGHTKEELLGRNHFFFFPNAENEEIFRRARDGGEPVEYKAKPFEYADQPWRGVTYWDWLLHPVKDESGAVAGLVFSLVDVTETVRARLLSEALNSIGAMINSTLDHDEILQRVLVASAEVIRAETASIALLEDGRWVVRYLFNLPEKLLGLVLSGREDPRALLAAASGAPVVIEDAGNDERIEAEIVKKYGIRSVMVVPLLKGNDAEGALFFNYHSGVASFSAAQLDFAGRLATCVSLSLGNAHLYRLARKELERTRLLQDVAAAVTGGPDAEAVSAAILEALRKHMDLKMGDIKVLDPERLVLSQAASFGFDERTLRMVRDMPLGESGFLTQEAVRSRRLLTHEDEILSPERIESLRGGGIENCRYIVTPVYSRGRLGGTFSLVFEGKRPFDGEELSVFEAIRDIIGQALDNARLYDKEIKARKRAIGELAEERFIADTLQEALLVLPDAIPGVDFAWIYRSATDAAKMGGDFFDLFELDENRIGIVIGDVSGKGIKAAALTSLVRNVLKAYALEFDSPAASVERANRMLRKSTAAEFFFVTFFFAIFDRRTAELSYVNGGHPPGVLRRADGTLEMLRSACPPFGVLDSLLAPQRSVSLGGGDSLILYTDGVTEARVSGGLFGEECLLKTIAEAGRAPARELPRLIFDRVTSESGGRLGDDVAILSAEFH